MPEASSSTVATTQWPNYYDRRSKLGKAEHLTPVVVGLDQPVAVEENAVRLPQEDLSLFVAHPGHKPEGHTPRPEFLHFTSKAAQVGWVVTCVGVTQGAASRVEDGVEAGDEHIGRNTGQQRLIDLLEYLPRREATQSLPHCSQRAVGCGHHQGRGH